MAEMQLNVSALRGVARTIREFVSDGWQLHDQINDIWLARTTEDPVEAIRELESFSGAIGDIEVVGKIAGQVMRIRTVGGGMEVIAPPAADPRSLFGDDEIEDALEAWEGDVEAALRLSMSWRITAILAPAQVVSKFDEKDVRLSFAVEVETIAKSITSSTQVQVNRYVPDEEYRLVYVALEEGAGPVHLGTVSFTTVPAGDDIALPDVALPLVGEADGRDGPFSRPHCFLPLSKEAAGSNEWDDTVLFCRVMAGFAFWVAAASNVVRENDNLYLSFIGFKRAVFELPRSDGFPLGDAAGNLQLREWTFQDSSSDRLLALRQIVSLYGHDSPFNSAADIQASAEVVYLGLRTNAITEVVKTTRDAQAQTLDTVRQALKSSQDLVKAATERFLAGLVAVGAIFIANVSRAIPESAIDKLWLVVAAFFLVLALISVVVEGPALSLQMRYLPDDVRVTTAMLTDKQRASILDAKTVNATKNRVRVVRVAVPLVYVVLIFIIVWFSLSS